ncbi:phosphate acetyltransferase [Marinobacter sp.]|uniref:phosphate acetyltransferase n=1 Tax=Marinobacter sp. TaxID=50741 RepID=UPI0035688E72
MAKSLFIAPTSMNSGLTSVCLGLFRALEREGVSVGFFKPFTQSVHQGEAIHNGGKDSSVAFVRAHSDQELPDPIPLKQAQQLLNHGKGDLLLENVIGEYQKVASNVDVVIIEGLVPDSGEAYIARLNVEVARNLGSEVILVSTPKGCTPEELDEELEFSARLFTTSPGLDVIAVILNKIGEPKKTGMALAFEPPKEIQNTDFQPACKVFSSGRFHLLGQIPWNPKLLAPRVSDVARELGINVLHEGEMYQRRVQKVSVCARTIRNMTDILKPGTLLVTPGDREDIVVTTAVAALNGVPLAGLMLTGGLMPDDNVIELCRRALDTGLPILSSQNNTFESAHRLACLSSSIPIDDPKRVEQAMESVAKKIDTKWLEEHLKVQRQTRLSPPAFRYQLSERSRAANKRIVLPEGSEPRTVQAAIICHKRKLARCALIGDPQEIQSVAVSLGVHIPDDMEIINPQSSVRQRYIEPMVELRKHKGLTSDQAEALLEDNVVLGTMMVAMDEADGLVSGAIHTTANTVRPALQLIKTHDKAKVVSSVFFMLLPQQVLVYGDCAINPDPNAEELADIAIQSAESAEAFGIEPVVAMISYSTGESGTGHDVEKVREATRIARERRPDLLIDGPLQYDAAVIESVGKSKAPNSKVAGKATVFVFPDLNTGNTTYKAVQRSANVVSVGPMLQGLRKPVNDLSRGALVEDIVFTIALTCVQAKQVADAGVA